MVNWVVYSQFADHFGDQLLAASKVHDYLGFDPLGNIEVKTGGATGGSSVLAAAQAVASGYANCVPVVGWERMDDVSTKVGNSYIASAACKDFESELGWMYAAYYALMAQRYQYENSVPHESLAKIACKNHLYAYYSPFAQNPGKYTVQDVLENDIVSDPLTFLECCVMSVGSAVLILADEETAFKMSDTPIRLSAICGGTHTLRTADRRHQPILLLPNETEETYKDYFTGRRHEWPGFSSFLAARMAAYLAYNMAGIKDPVEDFDILETHDAFTISDIQTYEDIGLRPYGRGREFIDSGEAYLEGKLPDEPVGRPDRHDARRRGDGRVPAHRDPVAVAGQVRPVPRRPEAVGTVRQAEAGRLEEPAAQEPEAGLCDQPRGHGQPRDLLGAGEAVRSLYEAPAIRSRVWDES